ncbi:MAG: capsule assembly Wzi family protein, partial [Daejeonella sp.]
VGQDQLQFGYGENGRIILSNKAPSYPFIRMNYQPLKWLRFNYSHSWLQSGIIDSNATYSKGNTVYGPNREIYVQKFMATHSLNFFPIKGLTFSMGESMVYSDRLDIGYLMPLMFFKAYDQYASKYKITTGSNGQFFFQASSRNHLKNTHFYSTLFIDEIRLSSIFNSAKSRNQIGFNVGASLTDIFIPYLTIGTEYTRINPFVYQNLIEAQTYTNQNYLLGDWMGNDADRILGFIKYTPLPRLKISLQFQKTRKGGIGTLENQYFKEPQPAFMTTVDKKNTQAQFRVSYEWINNLNIQATVLWDKENNIAEQKINTNKQFNLGLNFGF